MAAKLKVAEGFLLPMAAGTAAGVLANQFPQNQRDTRKAAKDTAKKLKKIEPNFSKAAEDPDFNEKAAREAFDLVMKMDSESALNYMAIVVADVTQTTIEKNQRTLQRHLDEVISKRIQDLKRATVRAALVSKSDDSVKYAEALAELEEISKAQLNPYDKGYRFRESDFNRNPNTGQFQVKFKPPKTNNPLSDKQAGSLGILKPSTKLTPERKARYQSDYRQLSQFIDMINQAGGTGENDVLVHIKSDDGDVYSVKPQSKKGIVNLWDPTTEKVVGVTARPGVLNVGGASFALTDALGGNYDVGRTNMARANWADDSIKGFSDEWLTASSQGAVNTNERLYGRVATGSQYLASYGSATGNAKLQAAGAFGNFVGSHGAEAEKVIGPSMRKTAYRYRGTEKAPDQHIVGLYARAIEGAKFSSSFARDRHGRVEASPSQMAAAREEARKRTPTWEERELGRRVLVEQLGHMIPSKQLYGLQLASGHTPPSQGIMINKDGQIVTQAVGYGDDHYLPFDLKNLKALKGGEYVRTRSVGGPTSEDIYTGLMMGARRLTVVSRSGTFTVEFDPTFRGGRRYNDKAKRMTDRYEHLLDALESQQVDAKPIPAHIQTKIREEVKAEYGTWSLADQAAQYKRKAEEYKKYEGLTPEDEAHIEEIVQDEIVNNPRANPNQVRSKITADLLADKEFKYRLNGAGYTAALGALEEQFPYYIKVSSTPRRDPAILEPEVDQGYVMPRHNRPYQALHGYYNTRIAGVGEAKIAGEETGKTHASDADYQNYANKVSRRSVEAPVPVAGSQPGTGGSGTGGSEGGPAPKASDDMKEVIAEELDKKNYIDAAWELSRSQSYDETFLAKAPVFRPVQANDRTEFDRQMSTPEGRTAFERVVAGVPDFQKNIAQWTAYRDARNSVDRQMYTDELSGEFPERPFKFPGNVYRKTADRVQVQNKIKDLDNASMPVTTVTPYKLMDEKEMKTELEGLVQLKTIATYGGPKTPETKRELIEAAGLGNPGNAAKVMASPERIQKQIRAIHEMRILKANLARQESRANKIASKEIETKAVETRVEGGPPTVPEAKFQTPTGTVTQVNPAVQAQTNMGVLNEMVRSADLENMDERVGKAAQLQEKYKRILKIDGDARRIKALHAWNQEVRAFLNQGE